MHDARGRQALAVPCLDLKAPKLLGVGMLHHGIGHAQLVDVEGYLLLCDVVVLDLGGVRVDIICQIFRRWAPVLRVVPTPKQLHAVGRVSTMQQQQQEAGGAVRHRQAPSVHVTLHLTHKQGDREVQIHVSCSFAQSLGRHWQEQPGCMRQRCISA